MAIAVCGIVAHTKVAKTKEAASEEAVTSAEKSTEKNTKKKIEEAESDTETTEDSADAEVTEDTAEGEDSDAKSSKKESGSKSTGDDAYDAFIVEYDATGFASNYTAQAKLADGFNRAAAEQVWASVNAERAANGLSTLAWDEATYNFACKRAQALVNDYSHAGCGHYGENIQYESGYGILHSSGTIRQIKISY